MIDVKPDITPNVQDEMEDVKPNVKQAEDLFVRANTPEYRLSFTPLNHNRMMIPPIQALKANSMTNQIIQANKKALMVDAPCGKVDCKCK